MLTKDRADYRCMFDDDLVEEAKYNPTAELAVVLGERLDDHIAETPETQFLQDELRKAETLIGDLEDDVSYWKDELCKAETLIGDLEDDVSYWKGMWEELKTKQRD